MNIQHNSSASIPYIAATTTSTSITLPTNTTTSNQDHSSGSNLCNQFSSLCQPNAVVSLGSSPAADLAQWMTASLPSTGPLSTFTNSVDVPELDLDLDLDLVPSTYASPEEQFLPLTPERLNMLSSQQLGELQQQHKYSPASNFAFEPPKTSPMSSSYNTNTHFNPTSTTPDVMSGNVTPNDSLPRISRDFAPPTIDTRRPATSATYGGQDFSGIKRESNVGMFASPADIVPSQQQQQQQPQQMYNRYVTSDGFQQTSNASPTTLSYPATAIGAPSYGYGNSLVAPTRPLVTRPQTSDGLPSYPISTNVALPPARTLVGHYPPSMAVPGGYSSVAANGGYQRYGSFDQSSVNRYIGMGSPDDMQFMSHSGPAPKKRARRRYDEIERIYPCEWNGCDKAYGTLNHLNAHVAMQKHGEKRLPSQFKEMRKEWRRKKREEANASANKEYSAHSQVSMDASQSAQYSWGADSRNFANDSNTASMYSHTGQAFSSSSVGEDPFSHRGSAGSFLTSAPTWSGSDTRPTTANTVSSNGSPTDGRFGYTTTTNSWTSNQYDASANSASPYDRKPTMAMMPQLPQLGRRMDTDYATATQTAPTFAPYQMSVHAHNMI